jgi:hypothetical protein
MTKFQMSTSWEELDVAELPNGIRARKFSIGRVQGDEQAPTVFMVEFPPNCHVAAHTHECDSPLAKGNSDGLHVDVLLRDLA